MLSALLKTRYSNPALAADEPEALRHAQLDRVGALGRDLQAHPVDGLAGQTEQRLERTRLMTRGLKLATRTVMLLLDISDQIAACKCSNDKKHEPM